MRRIILLATVLFCVASFRSEAQTDTLYVSELYTTTLVFDTDLYYVNVSNLDIIAADIAKNLKNLFVMKAKTPFKTTASLTAVESNGRIHTFIVAYRKNPKELTIILKSNQAESGAQNKQDKGKDKGGAAVPVAATAAATTAVVASASSTGGEYVSSMRKADAPKLREVIDLPQGYYHLCARSQRIKLMCENIFAYSDITYVVVSIQNGSGVSYEAADASFTIESHNKGKRKIENKTNITPKSRYGDLTAAPKEKSKIAYSFSKITLAKDQVLKITLYEQGGQRNLTITLSPDDVNFAKRPQVKS